MTRISNKYPGTKRLIHKWNLCCCISEWKVLSSYCNVSWSTDWLPQLADMVQRNKGLVQVLIPQLGGSLAIDQKEPECSMSEDATFWQWRRKAGSFIDSLPQKDKHSATSKRHQPAAMIMQVHVLCNRANFQQVLQKTNGYFFLICTLTPPAIGVYVKRT